MRDVKSLPILLVFGLSFSAGCKAAPKHTICQLNVFKNTAYCVKTDKPDQVWERPISDMDKFVCRSIDDEQKVVEWMKRECSGNSNKQTQKSK